ncbi:MAG: hypothetical protein PHT32_03590, partial [Candidatus Omnitrophica bacterium]|nr:hypothetical protein [Candidatus Omnitrophota bacterium]
MENIQFDFNNIFSHNIGKRHGVTENDLASMSAAIKKAYRHVVKLISDGPSRIDLGLEWAQLPFQNKDEVNAIQKMGDAIAGRYENVISLGIGGSYLGLKAAQDALCPPYYNEFDPVRKGRPRIYFDGNNLDPDTLKSLLNNLKTKKTFVIVISKSGETIETKAAFTVIEDWLKKNAGDRYGAQVFAITDPNSGTLRKRVSA